MMTWGELQKIINDMEDITDDTPIYFRNMYGEEEEITESNVYWMKAEGKWCVEIAKS